MSEPILRILHVKHPTYLAPSETFVDARVLNPICQRPVPVITHLVAPQFADATEIQFFALESLNPFRHRLEQGIGNHWHWYPYYYQVIHRVRPQIIHAHFSGAGEACLDIAKRLDIPLLINFYGIETKYHLHDPFWIPRYKKMFARARWFTCLNNRMKDTMVAAGCPADKIVPIPLGVDTDFFRGEPTRWNQAEPLHLLSIARLHPEKGLNYLLEACHILDASGFTTWDLRIIGIGPKEAELKQQAAECGIERKAHFLGRQSPGQVVAELQGSHLMILPSLAESQGVASQEAQATGTPVIASNVGGIPGGLIDGQTGFLVEPASPEAIASKIKTFAEHPNLIVEMGLAGRQFVLENFSRKSEYAQLGGLYTRMIRDHNVGQISNLPAS